MLNKINKKLKNINLKKILLILIPISTVFLSIGTYFIFTKINKDNNKENIMIPDIVELPINENNIFPEIDSKDFYDLIEFKDGIAFIGDKMIASIIKDIVTRLGSVEGNLNFYIIENSAIQKSIYFKWINGKKELKKTYVISINSL